jgi:hypothetical protein
LLCGETYHIKLAIADAQDGSLQSFVTVRAGSLNTGLGGQAVLNSNSLSSTSFNLPENTIYEGNDEQNCRSFKVMLTPYLCSSTQDTIFISYSDGSATELADFYSNLPNSIIINPGDTIYHTIHAVNDGIGEIGIAIPGYPGLHGEFVDITYVSFSELVGQFDSVTQRVWILEDDNEISFSFNEDTAMFCFSSDLSNYIDFLAGNGLTTCSECVENYNIPYTSNVFLTETYCPDINDGTMMAITVSGTIETCCDVFEIFNGDSTNDPSIFTWGAGSSLPGTLSSPQQFLSTDTSGCITFSINPDVSVNPIITVSVSAYGPGDFNVNPIYYHINWLDEFGQLMGTEWNYISSNDSLHQITAELEGFCGISRNDSIVVKPYEEPHILGAENGIYYIDFCGQNTAYLPQIQGGLAPFDWYDYSPVFDIDTVNNQIIWNGVLQNEGIGFADQCGSWYPGPWIGMDTIVVRTKVDYHLWYQDSLNCFDETTPLTLASWDAYAPISDFFVQVANNESLISNGTYLCCGFDTISQLSGGDYHFQIIDELGCQSEETLIVWAPEESIDQIIGQSLIIPFNQYTYSVNEVIGADYHWTVDGGNVTSGQGTNLIQVMWSNSPSYIFVECSLPNGCVEMDTMFLDLPNSIEEAPYEKDVFQILVGLDIIDVRCDKTSFDLSVFNSIGSTIFRDRGYEALKINTEFWSNGVYFIELTCLNTKKVIKVIKS